MHPPEGSRVLKAEIHKGPLPFAHGPRRRDGERVALGAPFQPVSHCGNFDSELGMGIARKARAARRSFCDHASFGRIFAVQHAVETAALSTVL